MVSFAAQHLSFTYPKASRPALRDITFSIEQGSFVLLCGKSGCGKTTLLRHLKPALTPHGERAGTVQFAGADMGALSERDAASQIGFVLQNPENQIVTDMVWHELAFGLESLGEAPAAIRRRVAEMASFFGIESWFEKPVAELSGGQKQMLNLAAVMAMQPAALVLDEPTSQLDPIAASEFLQAVRKINRELGTTVFMSEHRLEEVLPMADTLLVMEAGAMVYSGAPAQVARRLFADGHDLFYSMPAAAQVAASLGERETLPLTVRGGRRFIDTYLQDMPTEHLELQEAPAPKQTGETALELKKIWHRYGKDEGDVLRGLSLALRWGEIHAVVGGNGTGKTTLLSVAAGLIKPYSGKVMTDGKPLKKGGISVGMLPQDPQTLFVRDTVREDLQEMLEGDGDVKQRVQETAETVEITHLLDMHPYDLSGGEQQRAALCKVLLQNPAILLMDEPTKGMDVPMKRRFAKTLERLKRAGKAVLLVSHDIEFCARYTDRCSMLFGGEIVSRGTPREFFAGNSFYTTSANRMARHRFPGAITSEDVTALCKRAAEKV